MELVAGACAARTVVAHGELVCQLRAPLAGLQLGFIRMDFGFIRLYLSDVGGCMAAKRVNIGWSVHRLHRGQVGTVFAPTYKRALAIALKLLVNVHSSEVTLERVNGNQH